MTNKYPVPTRRHVPPEPKPSLLPEVIKAASAPLFPSAPAAADPARSSVSNVATATPAASPAMANIAATPAQRPPAPPAPPAPPCAFCLLPSATGEAADPASFFRQFMPHHSRHDFNPMHHFSFEQYQRQHEQPLPNREGRRLAIAAPRGAAKSTIHTLLFPLMDILYGRERHTLIISGTMAQAKNRLATITRELRTNVHIRNHFFGGRMPRFKSTTRSLELNGCRIECFSACSEMRGVSHGEYRPTRIILDDVEHSRNSTRAYHRTKLLTWYDEIIENLGDSYTHITIVGTIIHTDSLLSTLLNRPGYKSEVYRSIIEWDSAPELWRTWQRLFTDRSDPDATDTARAFLNENREAMLGGTEVLWPSKEPYDKLQERLLISGRSAFFKEKQNQPFKGGDHIFDTSGWTRYIAPDGYIQTVVTGLTLEQQEAAQKVMADEHALDPSRPRTAKSDLKFFGFSTLLLENPPPGTATTPQSSP